MSTTNKPSFFGNMMRKITEIISFGSVFTAAGAAIAGIAALIDPTFAALTPEASFVTAGLAAVVGTGAVVANTALQMSMQSDNPEIARQANRLEKLEKINAPSPSLELEEELPAKQNNPQPAITEVRFVSNHGAQMQQGRT